MKPCDKRQTLISKTPHQPTAHVEPLLRVYTRNCLGEDDERYVLVYCAWIRRRSQMKSNSKPQDTDAGNEYHPEPQENINLFIVQVNWQYALNGVRVNVDHVLTARLELAYGDSWKHNVTFLGPVDVVGQVADDVGPERVVLRRQHSVQHEQLTDCIQNVEHLRHEKQEEEIGTSSASSTKTPWFKKHTHTHKQKRTPSAVGRFSIAVGLQLRSLDSVYGRIKVSACKQI